MAMSPEISRSDALSTEGVPAIEGRCTRGGVHHRITGPIFDRRFDDRYPASIAGSL